MKKITFLLVTFISVLSYAQTTFEDKVVVSSTASGPYTIDSGLIDDDAYPDIIVGTVVGNTLELFLNNQDGTFASKVSIPTTQTGVNDVKLVDLNNDSFLDLVVCGSNNSRLSWFSNDGDGNFSAENLISSALTGVANVAFGKIDGDDTIDLMASAYNGNEVVWFSNDGSGNFTEGSNKVDETLVGPTAISLKDVDGDGDLDALVSTANLPIGTNVVELFVNDLVPGGTVSFSKNPASVSSNKKFFWTAIFEDETDPSNSVIFATDNGFSSLGAIYRYESDGMGGFTETQISTTSFNNPSAIELSDLDNDSNMDLIVSSGSVAATKILWFKGNMDGTYESGMPVDNTAGQTFVFTSNDFDLDGDVDIASLAFNLNQLSYFENQLELLSVSDLTRDNLQIYPNPTHNTLNFKTSIQERTQATITDLSGKIVFNNNIMLQDGLDVSKLQDGYYVLTLNGNSHFKFVKH